MKSIAILTLCFGIAFGADSRCNSGEGYINYIRNYGTRKYSSESMKLYDFAGNLVIGLSTYNGVPQTGAGCLKADRLYKVLMMDSDGDGWEYNSYFTITYNSQVVIYATLSSGSMDSLYFSIPSSSLDNPYEKKTNPMEIVGVCCLCILGIVIVVAIIINCTKSSKTMKKTTK